MYNVVVMSSVVAVGLIELIKKVLPKKITETDGPMSTISVIISAIVGFAGVYVYKYVFNYDIVITQQMPITIAVATAVFAQINYPILVKVPKATYKKLEDKTTLDADKLSDEIANSITNTVEAAMKDVLDNSSKK